MKRFSAILGLVLSLFFSLFLSSARAQIPIEGTFRFTNQLTERGVLTKYKLYIAQDSERKKMAELQSLGYICRLVQSNLAACEKFEILASLPPEIENYFLSLDETSWTIVVSAPLADPEHVHKSEVINEWRYFQNIAFGPFSGDDFLFRSSQGVERILLVKAPEIRVFNSKTLALSVQKTVNTPKVVTTYYSALIFIQP